MAFGDWIIQRCAEYVHMKVVVEDLEALSASSPVMFASEPHDILPLSMVSFGYTLRALGTQKCIGCVSSACFSIPFMRHIWTWTSAASASRRTILGLLNQGSSPVICPGGAREVAYLSNRKECVLYLNERLGFIKLACRGGTPLVPVFTFGLRNAYDYWPIKNRFIQQMGRNFGFLPILFFGQFGAVFGPGKPCDLTNVVGRPIPVPKKSDPTEAELRAISKVYIEATREIFEKYKSEYGMADYELRIL